MRLTFERELPQPIEVAWELLTDPIGHNAWSLARMTLVHAGDGVSAGSVGTRRRLAVRVFGIEFRLEEVIVAADAPRRLAYRVVGGVPVRSHLGDIRLSPLGPDGRGTRLTWTVEASFAIPGQGLVTKWMLRSALGASLDALASRRGTEAPGELGRVVAEAERARDNQRRLAAELEAEGDPKHWFARVYAHVTEAQIERCRNGAFEHPSWVLRLVARFHTYYAANLAAWRAGRPAQVEEHWRAAFEAAEAAPAARDHLTGGLSHGLVEAIRAHVDGDLPRALAEVYLFHFAPAVDYHEFAPDYARMNQIFPAVQRRLVERMPRLTRLVVGSLPGRVRVALAGWVTYDVMSRRMRAFAHGEQVAALTTVLAPYRAQTLSGVLVPALATASAQPVTASVTPPPAPSALVAEGDLSRVYEWLHALLEAAELHRSPRSPGRSVAIVVEGAGAAPLAAEIAIALRRLLRTDYPHLGPGAARVIAPDTDQALATMPVALRLVARALLARSGAETHAGPPPTEPNRPTPGQRDADLVFVAPTGLDHGRLALALVTARWRAMRRLARVERTAGQRGVRWVDFAPGETIVRQGEPGDALYVIERGEAEVVAARDDGEQLVVELCPGDHFGERAVFTDEDRSATVRARSVVRALVIERVHALILGHAVPAFGDSVRRLPAVEREIWRDDPETLPT